MSTWLLLAPIFLGWADDAPARPPATATLLRGDVVDRESARPIPCRVSIRGEDGTWHFAESESPDGSAIAYRKSFFLDPSIVEMHTTLSAHPFVAQLPAGRYTVTVERGKEYLVERREITVGSTPTRLTIPLRRWIDVQARGWYSGDTHTHRPPAELPNVMLAEDVNMTFPLSDWVLEAFVSPVERRAATFRDPGTEPIGVDWTHVIVPRNTEYEIFSIGNAKHTLGAFFVINHKTPLDQGVPPVGPIGARAHREGALIEFDKHIWPWSMALVPLLPVDLYELANNHLWETEFGLHDYGEPPAAYMKVEREKRGLTEWGFIDYGLQNYYALLNCGFRLRPTAGSASGVLPVPLGFSRVYVRIVGKLTRESWLNALNEGRSFVTTGPMLFVTLDGHDPGHRFEQARDERHDYRLSGVAESAVPLSRIEVVLNGELARTLKPANRKTPLGGYESPIDESLSIDGSSWIAVRCFEDRPDHRVRFAHSGPFHIDVPGKPLRPRRVEIEYLIHRVESEINRSAALLPEPAIDEYRQALGIYRKIAETAR